MESQLAKYLIDAGGKSKDEIALDNPYRNLGFDGDKKRLGWMRVVSFSKIEEWLKKAQRSIEHKENFIFIGMGGSINGIKCLLSLNNKHCCYTLDSLDPEAIEDILIKIKSNPFFRGKLNKTLIIPISKSGTTKETQLLSSALRELFVNEGQDEKSWRNNFLWLADPESFDKLDSLGWNEVAKLPIQFDGETDIGGRFSCPHTGIFYLPLFLLLDRNIKKIEEIYLSFISFPEDIRSKAHAISLEYKDKNSAYFYPVVEERIREVFFSWAVQLFQESLGSKKEELSVKTAVLVNDDEIFSPVELDLEINNPIVYLMCQMYFFQAFIAFYSAFTSINFVNQDFVEKYKEALRKLEGEARKEIKPLEFDRIIDKATEKITPAHKFVEVVLYFYTNAEETRSITEKISKAFKKKHTFVFVGSDWNHHSYQAAFADKDTFFILLVADEYKVDLFPFKRDVLERNVNALKLIAEATYRTIKDKSVLFALSKKR